MKVIMQEDGKVSYNGYKETIYKKGQDITNIDKWAKDYFLKVKKAKEIVEQKKAEKLVEIQEKAEVKKVEEPKKVSKKVKEAPENKMIKEKDIENK